MKLNKSKKERSTVLPDQQAIIDKLRRVWYDELVEDLRCNWEMSMSWDKANILLQSLRDKLMKIRSTENVQPVYVACDCCDFKGIIKPSSLTMTVLLNGVEQYIGLPSKLIRNLKAEWRQFCRINHLEPSYGTQLNRKIDFF